MISEAKKEVVLERCYRSLQLADGCAREIEVLSRRWFCAKAILLEIKSKEREFEHSELAQNLESKKNRLKVLRESRDAYKKTILEEIKKLTEMMNNQDRYFKEQFSLVESEIQQMESCVKKTVTQPIYQLQREIERIQSGKKTDSIFVADSVSISNSIERRLKFMPIFDKAARLARLRKLNAKIEILQNEERLLQDAMGELVGRYPFSYKTIIRCYLHITEGDGFKLLLKRSAQFEQYKKDRGLNAEVMEMVKGILQNLVLAYEHQ